MSASPQNNNNDEGESKESELVHRSTASASASADIKLPGGPQTKQSPSTVSPQQDPHDQDDDDQQQQQQQQQDEPKGQTHSDEGPATAEDDSIMQGHPATQEQAQYETEVKEQDRWLPIANGSFKLLLPLHPFRLYIPLVRPCCPRPESCLVFDVCLYPPPSILAMTSKMVELAALCTFCLLCWRDGVTASIFYRLSTKAVKALNGHILLVGDSPA